MKLGMFVTLEWDAASGADAGRHLRDTLEQVQAARDAGFSSLWVPQHFLSGPKIHQFASSPILGMLAGLAPNMTLGTAVLLLPMLNPVLLAEEAATLDHLTDGKFILGVGLGYRDHEFQAFGVERKSRVPRLREYIDVMRQLWGNDTVSYHGKYVNFDNVGLSLRPRNGSSIPIWLGGAVDDAVCRAGEIGDAWSSAGAMSLDELKRWSAMFHQARINHGRPLDYPRQIARECFCGADRRSAVNLVRGPLTEKYARYAGYGWSSYESGKGNEDPFEAFARDRFVIGDEAFVRDELARYRDELSATEFRFRLSWAGLEQKEVLASIGRLGRIGATL
jgi:alkanesulfonate monooxygenase SsuD/methylene tetrahydromethanopterin reductase-like flavin-dependent oxidoreductase (luciferase family)